MNPRSPSNGARACTNTSGGRFKDWADFRKAWVGSQTIHMLVSLKSTHCLADVLRELKKSATEWIHREIGLASFSWQEGYAAFTVSPTGRGGVKSYIANQEFHHRTKGSREELLELLALAEVEYNPEYFE